MAIKHGRGVTRFSWGKSEKKFAEYIDLAGKNISKRSAEALADLGAEFMANEDWDWPRGARYDTVYNGRNVRASGPYASGYRGGDAMHPWYSGTLHDSISVGIFNGTRLFSARYMTPGASSDQTYNGMKIDGVMAGQNALRDYASRARGNSVKAVLIVGAPYAEELNTADMIGFSGKKVSNTHQGYADYLENVFYGTLRPRIEKLRKLKLRLK